MRIRHILLCLFFINTTVYSQATVDSITLERWTDQAMQHILDEKIDSFSILYTQICEISKADNNLLNWIGIHRSAGRAFKKTKAIDKALVYLQKSFTDSLFRQPNTAIEWEELGKLYIYTAYLENNVYENFSVAEKLYNEALEILVNRLGQSTFYIARYLYTPLGTIYTKTGDIDAAKAMYTKSSEISTASKEYNHTASILAQLSTAHLNLGEIDKAIETCQKGLTMNVNHPKALSFLYSSFAKALFADNQTTAAISAANTAYDYLKILSDAGLPAAPKWIAVNRDMLGEFYTKNKSFDAANSSFQNAESILIAVYPTKYERHFAKHYHAWAMSKIEQNDTESALQFLQQSLQSLLPTFKENDPFINPKKENLKAENTFQDILLAKADIFEQKFDETGEQKYLIAALECHELIFEVEQLLRQSYYYESSKLFNVAESRERCGNAIQVALKLATKTNDQTYKKKAFEFAERSKSILLLEYFIKNDAQQNSAIPDSVLKKEASFQEIITTVEEELYNLETASTPNASNIQSAQEKLFKQKKAYDTWTKGLEKEYPDFYANKYNYSTICVDEVQNELVNKNETILEYFVSESIIYLFVFTKNNFNVISIKKESDFEQTVIDFHQSIEAFQHRKANRDSLCQVYTTLAHKLYVQLLQPVENLDLASNVKVVPSGILAFLPFDALLTEAPQELCAFGEYPYALHKYNISYDYSLTLHERMKNIAPRLTGSYVGFAPEFDGENGFSSLQFNTGLIEDIAKLWKDGKPVSPEASTIKQFQELVDKYAIIHLATHAEANMDKGNYSFIVFADGNGDYDSLFVRDIYELRFLAEMVVLSACETAIGELHDGEGIISLARAFLQSGSRSAITTLWSINEGSSTEVMLNFYKSLAEGNSKSKALQEAKAKQTDSDNVNAHPVFWAAYTPYGQMNPVVGKTNWWPYAAGGGALFLIFFLNFRRKNKNTNS